MPTNDEPITADEVASWMKDAAPTWATPSREGVAQFAGSLEAMRQGYLQAALADSKIETLLDKREVEPSDYDLMKQITNAVNVLLRRLPAIISRGRAAIAQAAHEGDHALVSTDQFDALVNLNNAARGMWSAGLPTMLLAERPTRTAEWSKIAELISQQAIELWKRAGVKQAGVGQPTSPAVKMIEYAVPRITGAAAPEADAISRTLRRKHSKQAERG